MPSAFLFTYTVAHAEVIDGTAVLERTLTQLRRLRTASQPHIVPQTSFTAMSEINGPNAAIFAASSATIWIPSTSSIRPQSRLGTSPTYLIRITSTRHAMRHSRSSCWCSRKSFWLVWSRTILSAKIDQLFRFSTLCLFLPSCIPSNRLRTFFDRRFTTNFVAYKLGLQLERPSEVIV